MTMERQQQSELTVKLRQGNLDFSDRFSVLTAEQRNELRDRLKIRKLKKDSDVPPDPELDAFEIWDREFQKDLEEDDLPYKSRH